jgi:diguanylate cyclase (GGDEF)-like protein
MMTKARILVVNPSKQERDVHATTLRAQGYETISVVSAEEAIILVETEVPDLFLIASDASGVDGYSLCRQLKSDPRLLHVPVIFTTHNREPENISRSYAVGAVDYLVLPCHLNELLARVGTHIHLNNLLREVDRLREIAIDSNPLTRLPGNHTIMEVIQDAIDCQLDLGLIYTDLDNFKAYNDAYGFSAGDDVLLFNAEVLQTALQEECAGDGFIGHIGGDDFVVMVAVEDMEKVGAAVVRLFDAGAPKFYSEKDRARGGIVMPDRNGMPRQFPFVTISMGGLAISRRNYTRYVEIAASCAEVKHSAKEISGSNLFVDRRSWSVPQLSPVTV